MWEDGFEPDQELVFYIQGQNKFAFVLILAQLLDWRYENKL